MGILGCGNSSSCLDLMSVLVPIACEKIPGPIKKHFAVLRQAQGGQIQSLKCGLEAIRFICLNPAQSSADSFDLYVLCVTCMILTTISTLSVINIADRPVNVRYLQTLCVLRTPNDCLHHAEFSGAA